jgi:putative DNA primase/helicase
MSNSLEILRVSEKQDKYLGLVGENLLEKECTDLMKLEDNSTVDNFIYDAFDADYLRDAPLTDTGNAECFLYENGENYRYNKTNGKWYLWDGVIWKKDEKEEINSKILGTIRRRQQAVVESFENRDIETRQKAYKYLVRCEDVKYRSNTRKAVEMLPSLITTIDQYDKDNYLIATQNGTLDLNSGYFYQSEREDLLTMQMGVDYDPDADCPRWKQFLSEIFNNDSEVIKFMQKIVGYSLTGDTIEQKMFIFYGFGKNGKSVFINTIQALLNNYAGTASFKTFDADKQSEMSNDVAALKGKRFVAMSESGAERRLNEPLIKQVTGGDRVSCRFLQKEFFEYVPQFKLFLATNHKPIITQSDFGIWRRLVLIPFTQNFDGREDEGLREKLMSELSGILNWALEGLKSWKEEGLQSFPQAVKEATDEYKEDSDTIGQWFEQKMIKHPASSIKSSEAHKDYKNWCLENGYYGVGNKVFKAGLEEMGFRINKKSDGNYWEGFGLPFVLK